MKDYYYSRFSKLDELYYGINFHLINKELFKLNIPISIAITEQNDKVYRIPYADVEKLSVNARGFYLPYGLHESFYFYENKYLSESDLKWEEIAL